MYKINKDMKVITLSTTYENMKSIGMEVLLALDGRKCHYKSEKIYIDNATDKEINALRIFGMNYYDNQTMYHGPRYILCLSDKVRGNIAKIRDYNLKQGIRNSDNIVIVEPSVFRYKV